MVRSRNIALLYALLATLALLLLAPLMPPMQNPDEAAHSFRADQISHGVCCGVVLPDGEFGGRVDSGLIGLTEGVLDIPGHPERKITPAMVAPRDWGRLSGTGFPNTAIYPPLFYLPAALAGALARSWGFHLPTGLVGMRIATGLVSIGIGSAAIVLAEGAAIWLFAILLLPMSLALTAAVSQDGPMLACAALAAALHLRLRQAGPRPTRFEYLLLCLLLTGIAMARPPYAAFAIYAATVPGPRSQRALGGLFILAGTLAWVFANAGFLPLPERANGIVSPPAQIEQLLLHIWRLPALIANTVAENGTGLARGFIGELGWQDTHLPILYHRMAWCALALTAACVWHRPWAPWRGWEAAAILGCVAGLALAEYLTWTIVGGHVVQGMQGRYFLVPAILSVVLFSDTRVSPLRWRQWVAVPVLLFPVFSIAVAMHAILLRYYL